MSSVKVDSIVGSQMPLPKILGVGDSQTFVALASQTDFVLTSITRYHQVRVFVGLVEATYTWLNATTIRISAPVVAVNNKVHVFKVINTAALANATEKAFCTARVTYRLVGSTVTIVEAYNVSSVQYNSAGDVVVNFTNPMANTTYGIGGSIIGGLGSVPCIAGTINGGATLKTTAQCRVNTYLAGATPTPTNFYEQTILFFGGV